MLKKLISFSFLLLLFFDGKSQTDLFPKHAIVLDAAGIGGYGSLNYERIFFRKKNYTLSGKIGFSFYRLKDYELKINPDLLFPISLHIGRNWKSHHAIFGIGQTISSIIQANQDFKKIRKNRLSGSLILGYKFQKMDGRFFFQIAYTPIFNYYNHIRNWGGLSVGYLIK